MSRKVVSENVLFMKGWAQVNRTVLNVDLEAKYEGMPTLLWELGPCLISTLTTDCLTCFMWAQILISSYSVHTNYIQTDREFYWAQGHELIYKQQLNQRHECAHCEVAWHGGTAFFTWEVYGFRGRDKNVVLR